MKLGVCLPVRPRPGEVSYDRPERWGCLRPGLHEAIWRHLGDVPGVEVRQVDFRGAWSDSGTLKLGDTTFDDLDGLFWYCEIDRTPGSYELQLLKTLARTLPVHPDPWRWEVAVDKYAAHLALRNAGVPVPDFALLDPANPSAAVAVLESWGAALLKPRRGAWGKGVLLVEHASSLRDLSDYLAGHGAASGGLYLERYLHNEPERWVSATTLGGKPVFGYRKRASKRVELPGGRYKVFDADEKGGEIDYVQLDAAQTALAERAAVALGCPILGFDMIEVNGQPVIIDENTSPGNYPALYEAAGVDPGEAFCRAIVDSFN
jgi:ribosomal protein S6--L-glutamate ligase